MTDECLRQFWTRVGVPQSKMSLRTRLLMFLRVKYDNEVSRISARIVGMKYIRNALINNCYSQDVINTAVRGQKQRINVAPIRPVAVLGLVSPGAERHDIIRKVNF